MYEIIAYLILCAPLFCELMDDFKGDKNKIKDVFVRGAIAISAALIVMVAGYFNLTMRHGFWPSFAVSISTHLMFFDYAITYIMIENNIIEQPGAHWFTYMGKSSKDDQLWKHITPWGRFAIKLGIYIGTLIWYFI